MRRGHCSASLQRRPYGGWLPEPRACARRPPEQPAPPRPALRYLDAARCFNAVLLYIYRVKAAHRNSPSYDQMLKKNEQMYGLLACCLALCPAAAKSLDENVLMQVRPAWGQWGHRLGGCGRAWWGGPWAAERTALWRTRAPARQTPSIDTLRCPAQLRERQSDNIASMGRGDMNQFSRLFSEGCPKFVTTSPPAYDQATANTNQLVRPGTCALSGARDLTHKH